MEKEMERKGNQGAGNEEGDDVYETEITLRRINGLYI